MIDLREVMTFSEAAEKWGFANGNTIRKAVERKKFKENEIRKSGDVWLTTYEAMQRVFGYPKTSVTPISYSHMAALAVDAVYDKENSGEELERIFQEIAHAIEHNQSVPVIESEEHPEHILYMLKTKDDLAYFEKITKRYFQSF